MSLILKKFIGDDQVDGEKVLLDYEQPLRAKTMLGAPANLFRFQDGNKINVYNPLIADTEFVHVGSVAKPFGEAVSKQVKISDGAVSLGGLSFNSAEGIDSLELSSPSKNVSMVSTTGNVSLVALTGIIQMVADAALANGKKLTFNDADGSHITGLKASAVTTETVDYSLPPADGNEGQFLTTDGAGQMSWSSPEAAAQWNREMLNIDGSNQVTLAHEPIPESLIVFVDGVMMRYGVDYEVNAGAATKLDFNLPGAEPSIVAGDDIYIQYQY